MAQRLPKSIEKKLSTIRQRLEALSEPSSRQCGLNPDIKEAVRLYVRTWILEDVKDIEAWNAGAKRDADGHYRNPFEKGE